MTGTFGISADVRMKMKLNEGESPLFIPTFLKRIVTDKNLLGIIQIFQSVCYSADPLSLRLLIAK